MTDEGVPKGHDKTQGNEGEHMDFGYFMIHRVMLTLIPLLMLGIIVFRLIQSARQWNRDNNSPKLTVPVRVVARRADTSRRKNTYRSRYFVTFQFESGDRLELELQGREYGLLVEGDKGKLNFQGSRYLGFDTDS